MRHYYKIVDESTVEDMVAEVERQMDMGFTLQGGVAVYVGKDGKPVFCQAVVKSEAELVESV